MSKFAIGLLTLAVYATSLVAVPVVTPATAAAESSKQIKKHKKIHRSPGIANARSPSANPFPPMDEDPDRMAGGGGGGY
jgi:hypothetical protein